MARRKGTARVNKAAGEISTKVQASVNEQAVSAQAVSEKAVKEEAVKTEDVVTKTVEDAAVAAEQKAEVKETAQDNAAKDAKKAAVKKTEKADKTEKKTTVKKAAEKTEEKQARIIIQYAGKEFSEEEIITKAKEAALAQSGLKRLSSIKDIDVYCKPEEHAAYYVANGGKFTGRIEL